MVLLSLQISKIFKIVKLISAIIVSIILWKPTEMIIMHSGISFENYLDTCGDDVMICHCHKMFLL